MDAAAKAATLQVAPCQVTCIQPTSPPPPLALLPCSPPHLQTHFHKRQSWSLEEGNGLNKIALPIPRQNYKITGRSKWTSSPTQHPAKTNNLYM